MLEDVICMQGTWQQLLLTKDRRLRASIPAFLPLPKIWQKEWLKSTCFESMCNGQSESLCLSPFDTEKFNRDLQKSNELQSEQLRWSNYIW